MIKINKKIILTLGLIIAILICFAIYLKPIPLSNIAKDNNTLLFTKIEMGVVNGQAYSESTDYNDVTTTQTEEVFKLFDDFSCSRNLKTIFSNGSMSNNKGDGYLYISVFNDTDFYGTILVSYDNQIAVNDKNYTMNNSAEFIDAILEVINE